MSGEEELELRDLVAQTLELNGCFAKIRAQLRANVFLTLDEDKKISKQQPMLNKKVKSCLQTNEGQIMFCLIRDFLEYFELDFTLSVYEPESYSGVYYKYEGKKKLLDSIGLKNLDENYSGPILLELVKIAQSKAKTIQINLPNVNGDSKHETAKESDEECSKDEKNLPDLNSTYQVNSPTQLTPSQETLLTENGDHDDNNKTNGTSIDTNIDESCDLSNKSKTEEKSKPPPKSKLKANVNVLPFLCSKDLKDKSSSKDDLDFDIDAEYEEDFMSSSEMELSLSHRNKSLAEELGPNLMRPKSKQFAVMSKPPKPKPLSDTEQSP